LDNYCDVGFIWLGYVKTSLGVCKLKLEIENTTGHIKVIVGLGKTGLSCARYLFSKGQEFMVVDSCKEPPCLDEFRQEFPAARIELGEFSESTFTNASELIVSPGVSLDTKVIAKARACGVPVSGDIDIFSKAVKVPIIAVTGSNGKSTVVSLLAEIFKKANFNFGLGGNLDGAQAKPALELLIEPKKDLYVLELSSFQLETTECLSAEIAVILNVSEDHVDRYDHIESYLDSKQRIFRGCKQIVVNRDSEYSAPIDPTDSVIWEFGIENPPDFGFRLLREEEGEFLAYNLEKIISIGDLKVFGQHNISNVLAAMTIAKASGVELDKIADAVRSFEGLPHRCQWVAEVEGVKFYNDSKGTNVGATISAVEGLGRSLAGHIILIAGGVSKGADFTALVPSNIAVSSLCEFRYV
jgi:UDP-N-acetylmuramoylalanine--D-glutamate ligase